MSGPARSLVAIACIAVGLFGLCFVVVSPASAQTRRPAPPAPAGPTPRAGSWEIGGSYLFVGGYDFGQMDADLTRNTTTGTGPVTQFVANSSVEPAHAVLGRIAYYLSPRLAIEGGARYGQPVFRVRLSEDFEGAPASTAEEKLHQYLFDAAVLWHFPRAAFNRGRAVPFVYGGAGYLRELHEGQEHIETGIAYQAGGGVKFWFGNARRRFGLRGEGGVSIRDGGFDFEEKARIVPTAGASLIYLF